MTAAAGGPGERPSAPTVNGILNVNKPTGPTSFDIIRLLRQGTGIRKAGHAGTLDPMASGVLLVLLGQAARISQYLMDLPKTYRAVVRLGVSTDTYDAEGAPTHEARLVEVTRTDVNAALKAFVGEIEQTPPAYSAIKVKGQPAHRLARRGAAVTLAARLTRIDRIVLLRFESPDVEIAVDCGKGTYIRSLAHDLGQELGCGAHLAALVRTRVGQFSVESAMDIPGQEHAFESGEWRRSVLPLDRGLTQLPAIKLHIEEEENIRHGQAVRIGDDRLPVVPLVDGGQYRTYAEDGGLVGIIRYDGETGLWRPHKVFERA